MKGGKAGRPRKTSGGSGGSSNPVRGGKKGGAKRPVDGPPKKGAAKKPYGGRSTTEED